MKLDKEFVLKHQFWLLLGVFGLFWLTSLTVLAFAGGVPIDAAKKSFDTAQNAIKPYTAGGAARPKNESFWNGPQGWDQYGTTFKNHKNAVWGAAWSGDEMDPADAEFKNKPLDDSKIVARRAFRNGSWKVVLLFERSDKDWLIRPDSSIENVDGGHHELALNTPGIADGVWFRLRQDGPPPLQASAWARPYVTQFAFEGPPVPWGEDKLRHLGEGKQTKGWAFRDSDPNHPFDPTQPVQLQQIVAYPWTGQGDMYTWPGTEKYDGYGNVTEKGDFPLNALLLRPSDVLADDVSQNARSYYKGGENFSPYREQFEDLYKELNSLPTPPPRDRKKDPTPTPPPGLPFDPLVYKGSGADKLLFQKLFAEAHIDASDADRLHSYSGLMHPVDVASVTNAPSIEECWLMQEDFWVKRELLHVVRDAMNMAARMELVDAEFKDAPLPDPKITRHVYRNASWEVTLLFDHGGDEGKLRVRPDSTIKNVHVSHRTQARGSRVAPDGVWFRLRQPNTLPATIAFEGEPLAWGQQATIGQWTAPDGTHQDWWPLKGNLDPTQPMQLEQVFDATNSPITEIDAIAISQVSHRNANRELVAAKPDRYSAKAAAPAPGAPPANTPPASTPPANTPPAGANPNPGGTPGQTPGGPGGGAQGAATAAESTKTPNYAIERNRYLFVTDQSRHLPLAITLTVDQAHLPEVLAAFANSKLRFQTTQVEFRRVPAAAPSSSSTQPNGVGTGNPNPGAESGMPPMGGLRTPGAGVGPPSGGTGGGVKNPNGVGTPGGMGTPDNSGANAPTVPADNPNLIRVTIYGVASLYERPPDVK